MLKNSFDETRNNFNWLQNYKLKFYFLISFNIFSLLIHNRSLNSIKPHYTTACNQICCKTCEFVNSNSYIYLNSGFIIPIKHNSSCTSLNVIYIIRCTLCNVFYIGQTKRSASERIVEHLRDIKNLLLFSEGYFSFNNSTIVF